MTIQNALAGIAVTDLASAVRWYEGIFGRAADSRPMPEVAEWRFERGGWIQVFHDEERAGSSSVTLTVSDLDSTLQQLQSKGVSVGDRNVSKSVKTAIVRDPDGNRIVLAEPQTKAIAQ